MKDAKRVAHLANGEQILVPVEWQILHDTKGVEHRPLDYRGEVTKIGDFLGVLILQVRHWTDEGFDHQTVYLVDPEAEIVTERRTRS